jgi:hypothetical protein
MSIVLFMQPAVPPINWESFCKTHPPFSVAIDGYVRGGPSFDKNGPHVNFNHHEEVNRLATRATCSQIFVAVKQGLFTLFCDGQKPRASVYANDCDEDVCLSWTILKYGSKKAFIENPTLKALVEALDLLDTTSGMYSFPKRDEMLRHVTWIFEPYRNFRLSGEIDEKNTESFVAIVNAVEGRINQYLGGAGKTTLLDTRYKVLMRESNWVMVEELGNQARIGMSNNGIRAFVSVRERPGGKLWTYTIGRTSLFVPFDLSSIFSALNKTEGLAAGQDQWGGGDTIGGSPRVRGSKLSPQKVVSIINDVIRRP